MKIGKNKLSVLAAILCCGLATTSCVDEMYDNPTGGDAQSAYLDEPSYFASYMDKTVLPGDDFYQHAVGKWLADHPLKDDEKENGTNAEQAASTDAFLTSLSDIAASDEVLARLKADYSPDHEEADKKLLMEKLDAIDAVTSLDGMYKQMAKLINEGYCMPVMLICSAMHQRVTGYLELPDKVSFITEQKDLASFMSDADAKTAKDISDNFMEMLVKKELMSNRDDRVSRLLSREWKPIRWSSTRADALPLAQVLTAMGYGDRIKDMQCDGWDEVNTFLGALSLGELKCFCKYFVVNRDNFFTAAEGRKFTDLLPLLATFRFSPLSVRLSALYNKRVPAANRAAAVEMAANFRQVFKDRIRRLPWMSEATKAAAIEKVGAMRFRIGWPDDDSKRAGWMVKVPAADAKASFYRDVCDLFRQNAQIIRSKLGSTDERDLFYAVEMNKASYLDNAFYSQNGNAFIAMSSNLVPPIFDPGRPDAVNYAVLGATTIGHEMTHGFDTRGHFYDKTGKNADWMTASETKAFDALTDRLADHFSGLVFGPHHCNGKATLEENVADLGGLNIGYEAFCRLLDKQGISGAERDRQCREFFRAFAYGWMANMSQAEIKSYDGKEHAIHMLRVNGNVYHHDEFYRLFGITGGKMYLAPSQRIHIW